MCQTGNPQGTHPCRWSGCAGQSCRWHVHHTWPENQWHQWYSSALGSRKYSSKKSLKGQNCFLLLQWLWCSTVSLMDPKDISSPLAGGQEGNIWPWMERAARGTPNHPFGLFVCSGTFLRFQLMLSWDPVPQSNSFLQEDFTLQQLPVLWEHTFVELQWYPTCQEHCALPAQAPKGSLRINQIIPCCAGAQQWP